MTKIRNSKLDCFDKSFVFGYSSGQDCIGVDNRPVPPFCHSGLDPWFDKLTTLS